MVPCRCRVAYDPGQIVRKRNTTICRRLDLSCLYYMDIPRHLAAAVAAVVYPRTTAVAALAALLRWHPASKFARPVGCEKNAAMVAVPVAIRARSGISPVITSLMPGLSLSSLQRQHCLYTCRPLAGIPGTRNLSSRHTKTIPLSLR
jgi:hypothetical protein